MYLKADAPDLRIREGHPHHALCYKAKQESAEKGEKEGGEAERSKPVFLELSQRANTPSQCIESATPEPSVEPEVPIKDIIVPPSQAEEEGADGLDGFDVSDPLFEMYRDIMGKFEQADKEDPSTKEIDKPEVFYDEDDEIPDEQEEQAVPRLSKKKRKEQSMLSVAELKALVQKPEIVDWTDT
ncbi:MAG: hypothetical protein Q9177_003385, partial [Variospora cf. flavescens]